MLDSKSVADILKIVENAVDDHNSSRSQDLRFNLLPPYKALLIQHVVGYITIFFTSQEQEYTRRHSLRGQLEEYRETAWKLFKNVVEKKTEDHITAGFFKQALTKSVIDHVSDMIPLDIQDTMLLKFTHQKYIVIRYILIYLAEKGEFDDCYRYISDPTTFVLEWLTNQMNTLIFDEIVGNSNQYGQFAKKHVRKIFTEIEKAVRSINVENAVKSAPQTANESFLYDDPTDIFNTATICSPVKKWIVSFTSYLTTKEILPISQYNFLHVTDKSEIDVYSFTQIVLEQLGDMEETVCRHFIKTTGNNIKWKKSPMTRIMDQLWGCTATCPFCYEPCKSTEKDHTELGQNHQCLQHRIKGLRGKFWNYSKKLTLNFCNVDVQGNDVSFAKHQEGEKEEWIQYNAYKTEYPNWYIEPSLDTSKYWMWLLCRYQKEFETKYEKKFEKVPSSWKKLSKKEALKSLMH